MNISNLTRWINASCNVHFRAAITGAELYCEHQDFSAALQSATKWVELMLNGPRTKQESKGCYCIEVDVVTMCSIKIGTNDYDIHRLVGQVEQAMNGIINIFKYGNDSGDNATVKVGCLELRNNVPHPIDVIPWGLVKLSDGILRATQTSVTGFYEMNLVE